MPHITLFDIESSKRMVEFCRMRFVLISLVILLISHAFGQETIPPQEDKLNTDVGNDNTGNGSESPLVQSSSVLVPTKVNEPVTSSESPTTTGTESSVVEKQKRLKKCCNSNQIYNFKAGECIDSKKQVIELSFASFNGTDIITKDLIPKVYLENQKCSGQNKAVVSRGSISGYFKKYDFFVATNYSLIVYNEYSEMVSTFDDYCVDIDSETNLTKAVLCNTIKTCCDNENCFKSESFLRDNNLKYVGNDCFGVPWTFNYSMLSNGFYQRHHTYKGSEYSDLYEDYCVEQKQQNGKLVVNVCNAVKKFCPTHMWLGDVDNDSVSCTNINKTADWKNKTIQLKFREYNAKNHSTPKIHKRLVSEINFLPIGTFGAEVKLNFIEENNDYFVIEYVDGDDSWIFRDLRTKSSIYIIMSVEILLFILETTMAAFYIFYPNKKKSISEISNIRIACFIIFWALGTLTEPGVWDSKYNKTIKDLNQIFILTSTIILLGIIICLITNRENGTVVHSLNDAKSEESGEKSEDVDIQDNEEKVETDFNNLKKRILHTVLSMVVAFSMGLLGYIIESKIFEGSVELLPLLLDLQFVIIVITYILYRLNKRKFDDIQDIDLVDTIAVIIKWELFFAVVTIIVNLVHLSPDILHLLTIIRSCILLVILYPGFSWQTIWNKIHGINKVKSVNDEPLHGRYTKKDEGHEMVVVEVPESMVKNEVEDKPAEKETVFSIEPVQANEPIPSPSNASENEGKVQERADNKEEEIEIPTQETSDGSVEAQVGETATPEASNKSENTMENEALRSDSEQKLDDSNI